jgi:hypothetical protein
MHWQGHNCPVGWQGQFIWGTSNILQSYLKVLFLMTVGSVMLFLIRRFQQQYQCAQSISIVHWCHKRTLSHRWYISLLAGVHKRCSCYSTREALIFLNEVTISEERCGVCFRPTEEVQHTNHSWRVLLSAHSQGDHAWLYYLTQYDHRRWEGQRLRWELSDYHFRRCSTCHLRGID